MSTYSEPSTAARNALGQMSEARSRALQALSETRRRSGHTEGPHSNLVPVDAQDPKVETVATQAVADYLIQLRPYRKYSTQWDIEMGVVELPETIEGGKNPGLRRGRAADWEISGRRKIPLGNLNELLEAMNRTIAYSRFNPEKETNRYKFVFGPQQLQTVLSVCDDVADEMGFLAEIEESSVRDSEGF
jgi:hypothetical protein